MQAGNEKELLIKGSKRPEGLLATHAEFPGEKGSRLQD